MDIVERLREQWWMDCPDDATTLLHEAADEIERLRTNLQIQWEENHFEHCGRNDHADGSRCFWPKPQ